MAKVLVTGGAGFIGSHIATRLVSDGHQVRVLDNFYSGHRSNLTHLGNKVELIEGDFRRPDDCVRAARDMEFIFHEGAIPSVPKSVENPVDSHDANINGTFNMLRAAVQCRVRRFIYAASSSAYGNSEESPKHERIVPAPLSPYAVQKLAGEHYCRTFTECFGLETISLRYFNVFGPRQDPKSQYAAAIPAFVVSLLRGQPPVIYGDGEQTRDFTYIDNVVEGNILAMKARRTCGESINVACGSQISVNRVIAEIQRLLGTSVKAKYVDRRPGDVMHSCADISLARKLLGFEPVVSFEEGLRRAIDFYRALA